MNFIVIFHIFTTTSHLLIPQEEVLNGLNAREMELRMLDAKVEEERNMLIVQLETAENKVWSWEVFCLFNSISYGMICMWGRKKGA